MKQRLLRGTYRGRVIDSLSQKVTRSMTMRGRKTLLDLLFHSAVGRSHASCWHECVVLDGFCGSGALGIESLSMGCLSVSFIDLDSVALMTTRNNIASLRLDSRARCLCHDMTSLPRRWRAYPSHHVFFLTPPWHGDMAYDALCCLDTGRWLHRHALGMVETARQEDDVSVPSAYHVVRRHACGDHVFTFMRYCGIES
ncbi:MAG: RsmD family RNA methyltransferase [Alphaproteobacteria bacterium GM7ARS4]|nr:RsmD family RNA methyltransferase [Alphaproteobacteria bacterium GM7ARS4]